jgi:CarboxypepD_reg-like domain
MKKKTYIIIFMLLSWADISAQDSLFLSGKIRNSNYDNLSSVHIIAFPSNNGSISNKEGDFHIMIKSSDTHLKISHIGYENKVLSLDSLSKFASAGLFIELKEKIVLLPEVIVKESKPKDIIIKAIENIQKNYFQTPQILRGFYRESAIEDDSLFYFVESNLGIYKTPYLQVDKGNGNSIYANQVKIDESLYIDFEKKSKIGFKVTHGAFNSLQCDYVSTRQFVLNQKDLKKLNLELKSITWFNNREVYEISFEDTEKAREKWTGTVFIDTESYAIIYIETCLTSPIRERQKNSKREILSVKTKTFYRPYKDKWVLSYIFAEQIERREVNKIPVKLDLFTELTISEVEENNVKVFSYKDIYKVNSKATLENYSKKYDSTYWKNKNYKLIDSDLLKKLRDSAKNPTNIINPND